MPVGNPDNPGHHPAEEDTDRIMADEAAEQDDSLTRMAERFVWGSLDGRPHWHRPLVHVLRLLWAVIRDVLDGQLTLRAMSLVYTTLLSLVPLLAISFSILKGFGVHNQIEPFLENALEPLGDRKDEIIGRIVGFVDNVEVGVLGSVGFVLLFYTVISLMQKIELAFNDVWQITAQRTFAERFKDYLSVILVGPALVFISIGITAAVMSDPLMETITSIGPLRTLVEFVGRLVPMLMVSLAFSLIYMFVPYTRVRALPAFTGGLLAGVMWNLVGWIFAGFVSTANNYTAIYSGFATPILFMIWLYVGWLILLLGATVAFYRQHPEYLSGRQLTRFFSHADRERLVLQAVRFIGRHFYAGKPPPSAEELSSALLVPTDAIEQALHSLQYGGMVAVTNSTPPGYLPGCPWENVTVYEVLEAAHEAPSSETAKRPPVVMDEAVQSIIERRREASRKTFADLSLKDLAQQPGEIHRESPPLRPRLHNG